MKRYFFHMRHGNRVLRDTEGTALPDDANAIQDAIEAARKLVADILKRGEEVPNKFIDVENEDGFHIYAVGFRSVVRLAKLRR